MSDILIKNMDLSEERHIIITKKGEVLRTDYRGISMPTDSSAVEVKPLVEKYRLYNHLENKYCEGCTKDCDGNCIVEKMLDDIDDFPTVLEANE